MTREQDARVAAALGWADFWESRDGLWLMGYPPAEQGAGIDAERHPVPHYSTDIAAAWTLVEYLCARDGVDFYIEYTVRDGVVECWCKFDDHNHEIHNRYGFEYMRLGDGEANTPADAIVEAFLAAVEQ